ncbi:zinc protease [Heyndrickxia shackletonii]|uniref:Zinc protease n=1 Tax=Heyndrickxia shackletonii TaxID=157838 RepID=A0A0Q3X0D9_9BACI|nr:pitrilysin family protein [Heyndrickxia shackletonii]KQL55506.1 zinc protease [Heyndrickxia shackletonii]MBB2478601.1 insulinase family protein [Bacillus sp. APMAM]NEY98212.1 insulinase family protein [Heyndrickxia shackletonii]RTZ57747.1 insulinase family protein [Bacillus sp. SAJ1]
MKNQVFEQLKETLYFEKMDNGLEVYILPKEGFNKTFATFTTKYGSVDNDFIPLDKNEYHHVPDGIAHFLEHKLFEKEDGDVFQQFSKQGASANAFTTFNRTAYLFSSTSNVEKNLETLIDMVQSPYFTEKTVEKEKGIIGQEITMYDDNPDWRLYFGVIENMYKHHPVKIDIAGTIESISHITDQLLYECYNTFYHPSNMLLFIVGPVEVENIMKLVRDNQNKKDYKEQSEIKRRFEQEPVEVAETKKILHMNVQTPKCLLGVKAKDVNLSGAEMLKQELTINVLLDMLFGKSSDNYYNLYNEGLIDETFSYDFTLESGFGFAMAGGDTDRPDELAERLKKVMMEAKNGEHLTEDALDRTKKKKIGGFLRQLNSPEFIANQFTRYFFNGMNLFDVVPVLEDISFEDLKKAANEFIEEDRFTVCQVVPKK